MKNTLTLIMEKWGVSQVYSNIDVDYLEITNGDIPERVDEVLVNDEWTLKTDRFPVSEGRWVSVYEKTVKKKMDLAFWLSIISPMFLVGVLNNILSIFVTDEFQVDPGIMTVAVYALCLLPTAFFTVWWLNKQFMER